MLNALIVGCGDIGTRVGLLLQQQQSSVAAVVHSEASAARLTTLGFNVTISDLDQPTPSLPTVGNAPVIFYFAPPSDSGEHDPRIANFLASLSSSPTLPAGIVYISTTAVYGESDGNWVDERCAASPNTMRGKRRLDAESQLIEFHKRLSVPLTILRVAGIYSANRLPFQQIKAGRPILKLGLAPFSNRIHATDLAEVCIAAARSNRNQLMIFNVSDGNPGSISQYYQQVALTFGLPSPPEITWEQAEQQLSPMMLSYLRESKRIDNRHLIETLGIKLRYPTLESGLRQCADELTKRS